VVTEEEIMPWYRGVDCKNEGCKKRIALKRLSSPEEGALDARGSPGWMGAGVSCPHCGTSDFYKREDFMVFETLVAIPGEKKPETKPN
jgi:hypothetical protein